LPLAPKKMKLFLAPINSTVGDLAGNVQLCADAIFAGKAAGADLIILPEMAIPGYPPRDILYDRSFVEAIQAAAHDLATRVIGCPPALVGSLTPNGDPTPEHPNLLNVALLIHNGKVKVAAEKQLLPVYDVFYEPRWFVPGKQLPPLEIASKKVGVLICEDMWDENYGVHPAENLKAAGADLLVCLAASPWRKGMAANRLTQVQRPGVPMALVNLLGGNDELIFDGQCLAVNGDGVVIGRSGLLEGGPVLVDMTGSTVAEKLGDPIKTLFDALVLGIKDFARKNQVASITLGLSGGIDSAVAAVIAARSIGLANVTAIAIPSRFSDLRSTETAAELAKNLGVGFELVELEPLHSTAESSLKEWFGTGTVAENVQARLRGMILMAHVNKTGGMLLNTSNKTELALGYGTLYGDMAGAVSPLGDVTKPEVYALAKWINENMGEPIPEFIITRPPSAELAARQVDPFDYEKISPQIESVILNGGTHPQLQRSEHKRWQMGVVLKVAQRSFGSGRMVPITRK
jgi:NAD+ synthase (glutamine-hydrolysing)